MPNRTRGEGQGRGQGTWPTPRRVGPRRPDMPQTEEARPRGPACPEASAVRARPRAQPLAAGPHRLLGHRRLVGGAVPRGGEHPVLLWAEELWLWPVAAIPELPGARRAGTVEVCLREQKSL
jgi:hypothetical protein